MLHDSVIANIRKKRRHSKIFVALFLTSIGVTFGYLAKIAIQDKSALEVSIDRFNQLQLAYQQGGMNAFLEKKTELKEKIKKNLENQSPSQISQAATNMAIYLFPDLLGKDNFEKTVADKTWVPLQREIEKNPHTHQSRNLFEEMRAHIWNYENPDRKNPQLTDEAKQVIRIYDSLSR